MFDKGKSIFFESLPDVESNSTAQGLTNLLPTKHLKSKWPVGHQMDYGLRLELFSNDHLHEIKYELRVLRIENTVENDVCFSIDRISPVYINELEPDLLADQLAYKVSSIFYPMNVVLDIEGKVAQVQNITEIRQRWKIVKADLLQSFEGEIFEAYVSRMEKNIDDAFILNTAVKEQDWFLNSFFSPIYKNYNLENQPKASLYFPILPFQNVRYTSSFVLNTQYNDIGMAEVDVNGEINHLEIDNCMGTYKSRYILHPQTHQIWMMNSTYTFEEAMDHKHAKLDLFCIKVNGQEPNFNFDDNTQNVTSSKLFIEPQQSKNKSIWKNLFKS